MEIDLALEGIDEIIEWSLENDRRTAFFACLYRQVTERVRQGILDDEFDDGARMDRFDRVFADRYLVAFRRWRMGDPFVCTCWQNVLDGAQNRRPIILQHLLMGMNAHINLDLGVAAAEISTPETLSSLRGDFQRINDILAELLPVVRRRVGKLSPLLYVVDEASGDADTELVNFSMRIARREAWELATNLVGLSGEERDRAIERRRPFVNRLTQRILKPDAPMDSAVELVGYFEMRNVRRVVDALSAD